MEHKEKTYDNTVFEWMKDIEERHCWFLTRRKFIFDKIKRFSSSSARILEIGCGCGNVSSFLAKKGYKVVGCDYSYDAIKKAWPGFERVQADASKVPFRDNSFDIVGLFDILEHFSDDIMLLKEALKVLKKSGIIVVTVPARQELWSSFDEMSLHKRRYTKENLQNIFLECKIKILSINYMFTSLYLPVKFLRIKTTSLEKEFKINKLLNFLAELFLEIERYISKLFPLPIGTSIIVIGKKYSRE